MILNEKQTKRKEEIENNLLQNVTDYKENIEELKKRMDRKRKLISLKIAKVIMPYIITTFVTFGTFSLLKITPFHTDNIKKYLYYTKEIDSLGNIKVESLYSDYEKVENKLLWFGKWEKQDDNTYKRTIKEYDTGKLTSYDIEELVNKYPNGDYEKVFDKISKTKIETSSSVSPEELKSGEYIKGIISGKDKGDYIIEKEEVERDYLTTILYIFILFSALGLCDLYYTTKREYRTIKQEIDKIVRDSTNDEELNVKISNLQRKLKLKEDLYTTFKGDCDE